MTTEPIYLSAPYEDKPWFYVEQNPKTHPAAQPYYSAAYVAQLEADAARYRWLTEDGNVSLLSFDVIIEGASFEKLTAAIDEELSRSK
ncbi:hypothetical protein D3C75_1072020 [compost metagenome]